MLSCTTAPIYDHEGHLAAALDVSSCRADLTQGFLNLISIAVVDAARRIEADHFRLAFPDARIALAPTPENSVGALVAVDGNDVVIGATRAARLALGLTRESLNGNLAAADILGREGEEKLDLPSAERAMLQRVLTRHRGNVSAAAQQLGISRATLHRKLNRFGLRRPN